jgi:hypothetical protein
MKELLSKIKNKIKRGIAPKKTNPHIYWKNILYVFSFIVIILIIFSLYLMFRIKEQQIFQITPSVKDQPSLINEKLLKRVNEFFDYKQLKQKETLENPIIYKDPSLN